MSKNQVRQISKPPEVIDADFRPVPTHHNLTHRLGISAGLALPLVVSFGGAASGWWTFKGSMVGAAAWMVVLYGAAQWANPAKARGLRGLVAGLLAVTLAVLVSGCGQQTAQEPQVIRRIDPGLTEEQLRAMRAAEQTRLAERKSSLEKYRAEARDISRIPGALAAELNKCHKENDARLREGEFTNDIRCAAFEAYQESLKQSKKSHLQFQGGSLDYAPR